MFDDRLQLYTKQSFRGINKSVLYGFELNVRIRMKPYNFRVETYFFFSEALITLDTKQNAAEILDHYSGQKLWDSK